MKYNKLVRDKIPEIIKQNNLKPITRIASEKEYFQKLKEKLQEETNEFLKTERHEELADIIEVIYAILDHKNINKKELKILRNKKAKERGQFKNKIILEETKLQ